PRGGDDRERTRRRPRVGPVVPRGDPTVCSPRPAHAAAARRGRGGTRLNALARTQFEVASAARAIRASWTRGQTLLAIALVAAAAAPFGAGGAFDIGATARWLYLATAATALWLPAGLAGM